MEEFRSAWVDLCCRENTPEWTGVGGSEDRQSSWEAISNLTFSCVLERGLSTFSRTDSRGTLPFIPLHQTRPLRVNMLVNEKTSCPWQPTSPRCPFSLLSFRETVAGSLGVHFWPPLPIPYPFPLASFPTEPSIHVDDSLATKSHNFFSIHIFLLWRILHRCAQLVLKTPPLSFVTQQGYSLTNVNSLWSPFRLHLLWC